MVNTTTRPQVTAHRQFGSADTGFPSRDRISSGYRSSEDTIDNNFWDNTILIEICRPIRSIVVLT